MKYRHHLIGITAGVLVVRLALVGCGGASSEKQETKTHAEEPSDSEDLSAGSFGGDERRRVPTLETFLRRDSGSFDGPAEYFVARIDAVSPDVGVFVSEPDGGTVGRRVFLAGEVLAAEMPATAAPARVYYWVPCSDDDRDSPADCVANAPPKYAPETPATPFVVTASNISLPEWGSVEALVPEDTATGEDSIALSFELDENGDVVLSQLRLQGGPDYGRTITVDQFIYAYRKANAYDRHRAPFWMRDGSDICTSVDPASEIENTGDPGIDEFLADYVEGAGATATDEDFPVPQDRLDRAQNYEETCQANRTPAPIQDSPDIDDPDMPTEPPARSDSCGNGVRVYTPETAPPACPNPGVITEVTTLAQLQSWAANPVTSVRIKASIDFGGGSPNVATNCDVLGTTAGAIVNAENIFVAARKIDFYSDVNASGRVELRASDSILVRQAVSIGGAAQVVFEAPSIDIHGDATVSDYYCAEGEEIIVRQASRNLGGGEAKIWGNTSVDVHGDFENAAEVSIISGGDLIIRQAAHFTNVTTSAFQAFGQLDFHGIVTGAGTTAGAVELSSGSVAADAIVFRDAARVSNVGAVTFEAQRGGGLDFVGEIHDVGNIVWSLDSALWRQSGLIDGCTTARLMPTHLPEMRGDLKNCGAVTLITDDYRLFGTHLFTGIAECSLYGAADPSSETANLCGELGVYSNPDAE